MLLSTAQEYTVHVAVNSVQTALLCHSPSLPSSSLCCSWQEFFRVISPTQVVALWQCSSYLPPHPPSKGREACIGARCKRACAWVCWGQSKTGPCQKRLLPIFRRALGSESHVVTSLVPHTSYDFSLQLATFRILEKMFNKFDCISISIALSLISISGLLAVFKSKDSLDICCLWT